MYPQQVYYDAQGRPYTVPNYADPQLAGQSGSPVASSVSTGQPAGPTVGVPGGAPLGAAQPSAATPGEQFGTAGAAGTAEQTGTAPRASTTGPFVDVVEHPRSLEVYIDIPGFDEDDIQLDADAQTLRIVAERAVDHPDEAVVLQHERPPRFERTIQIPVHVEIEDAEASYEAGVCHVSLPKSDAAERTHTRIGFH